MVAFRLRFLLIYRKFGPFGKPPLRKIATSPYVAHVRDYTWAGVESFARIRDLRRL